MKWESQNQITDESPAPSTRADDMIESDNDSLRDRVSDLEKKVLEQNDEIVCLRSTLADVLRRLAQVECPRLPLNNVAAPAAPHSKNGYHRGIHHQVFGNHQNTLLPTPSRGMRRAIELHREPVRRVTSHSPSLPQRKGVHYQSTGSLDSRSSSSVSPVRMSPSPSPVICMSAGPSVTRRSPASTPTNLHTSKRWSSVVDFNPINASNNRLNSNAKSLYNLNLRSPTNPQAHNVHLKHGTRDVKYNPEEGLFRMFLRGRPVTLYAPSEISQQYDINKVVTAPQAKLKLDWVYGYRGKDCRSNLYLLPTGEMVYFVAAVAVLYNADEQSQRHYLGHTDDIKCLAIHPNKLLVATGQTAGHETREGKPHVRIWNSVSLATVCVLGLGEFDRSISCISFSKADGGSLLCAVDEANDHNISVWEWQRGENGHRITETKCSMDTVVACEFHPLDKNSIVTCGKGHISFWTLENGGALYKRQGIFEGSRDKPKYVTCLAFTQAGDVLSGDSNGNIIAWTRGKNTIQKIAKGCHEGSVFSICALKEGSIISGGGKDGRIVQYDSDLKQTGYEAQIADHLGGIRALSEGKGSQLLVGSTRNCILVGSLTLSFSPAVLGHTDELWALAVHPNLPQFLTAGFDKIVQLWDAMSHSVVWSKEISEQAQSAAFSLDGNTVVVGCVSGKWIVMDTETREIYATHTDGSEPIQVVSFSPNGAMLAVGSRDNNLYVYQVTDESRKFSRISKCSGHSSFITHVDWSADSQYLRTNSGDYELLYWNAATSRQVPHSSQLRDVAWATNTCTITFETIGIWPEGADGTDVNSCQASRDRKLLATGDDFGKVKLYAYPASYPKCLSHQYGGHSSHVTNIGFLSDDSRMISTGGNDTAVMQWQIIAA